MSFHTSAPYRTSLESSFCGWQAGAGPTPHKVSAQDLTAECSSHEESRAVQSRQYNEGRHLLLAGFFLLLAAYLGTLKKAGSARLTSKQDVTAEKNATSLRGLRDQSFLG